MSSFNWSDLKKAAEDAGFVVVPKGLYNVTITKSSVAKTGNGKDQIKVTFKILDGPFAGKPVNNNFVISEENPTALGFFFRHMKALGLDGSYFARVPSPSLDQVANDLLGRSCQIDVIIDNWQGEDRNKVQTIKPMGGAVGMAAATMAAMPQPQTMPQPQPGAMTAPTPQPAPVVAQPQPVAVQPQPAPTALLDALEKELAEDEPGTVMDALPDDVVASIPAPPGLPF